MEPDWREILSEKNGVIRELTAQLSAMTAERDGLRAEVVELSTALDRYSIGDSRKLSKIAALEKERDDLTQRLDSKIEALIHANDHCPEVDKKLALRDRQLELARKGLTRGCHCRPGGSICECCFCLAALEKTAGTEGGVCPNCQ